MAFSILASVGTWTAMIAGGRGATASLIFSSIATFIAVAGIVTDMRSAA